MRTLQGIVVSDKMNKTRVVSIERRKMHSRYQKYLRVTNRLKVHDPKNETGLGDVVVIAETRPLSRHKRWIISSVLYRKGHMEKEEVET